MKLNLLKIYDHDCFAVSCVSLQSRPASDCPGKTMRQNLLHLNPFPRVNFRIQHRYLIDLIEILIRMQCLLYFHRLKPRKERRFTHEIQQSINADPPEFSDYRSYEQVPKKYQKINLIHLQFKKIRQNSAYSFPSRNIPRKCVYYQTSSKARA